MDPKLRVESHNFDNAEASNAVGKKKSLEWDLNDWKWDGHHFVAAPLNAVPSGCKNKQLIAVPESDSLSSCSEETDIGVVQKGRGDLEKRIKVSAAEGCGLSCEDGSLSLKLGGQIYEMAEGELGNDGKKGKLLGGNSGRFVCQVEGCRADLSSAKDYHRRHKVCEVHAKASSAMVASVMQRFCQQCSRFHFLDEFDEGKRSCRRRLAGHNRRRRKTHPDTTVNGNALTDDKASSYLLISLLNTLSSLHADQSDNSRNQDLLSQLLENIASLAGSCDSTNPFGTLQPTQGLCAVGTSAGTPAAAANGLSSSGGGTKDSYRNPLCSPSEAPCNPDVLAFPPRYANSAPPMLIELPPGQNIGDPGETVQAVPSQCSPTLQPSKDVLSAKGGASCSLQHTLSIEPAKGRLRVNDFDLNCMYNETQDGGEGGEQPIGSNRGTASIDCPSWTLKDSHQSSPPQISGNSDASSVQSLPSSNEDLQSRTDRIVFKLFGRDPNDLPLVLRAQILDWLSHTPTDMESYIRPGCIVLTVYLCLDDSIWEELNHDLCSSLSRLLATSREDFWRKGWLYVRLQDRMAFIYNGHVILDVSPLLQENPNKCHIVSVTPIAVPHSARVSFRVQGFNLAQATARLLCAFDGKYLDTETTCSLVGGPDPSWECGSYPYLSFSCLLPDSTGRGVIEVEDHGLSNGFFPFVVAEEDVCCEIRMLENLINLASCGDILPEKLNVAGARNQALNFLNEMGWLLQRSNLKVRSKQDNYSSDLFSLKRFRWLMTFAMDWEWCAVVKKLLDILFQGIVELGGCTPSELALSENLLHIAVEKNYKLMVKFLVTYKPTTTSTETTADCFLFRPDMLGPSDITPLHIAASLDGAEVILDALISDPGQHGMKAWETARDSSGFTPEDYAIARGHRSYVILVQRKIDNAAEKEHVVLDILGNVTVSRADGPKSSKLTSFNIEKSRLIDQLSCKLCEQQQLAWRAPLSRTLLYRPLILTMVGIAAVCVCVGLLFKGPPEVTFVHSPFSWESLDYGTI